MKILKRLLYVVLFIPSAFGLVISAILYVPWWIFTKQDLMYEYIRISMKLFKFLKDEND